MTYALTQNVKYGHWRTARQQVSAIPRLLTLVCCTLPPPHREAQLTPSLHTCCLQHTQTCASSDVCDQVQSVVKPPTRHGPSKRCTIITHTNMPFPSMLAVVTHTIAYAHTAAHITHLSATTAHNPPCVTGEQPSNQAPSTQLYSTSPHAAPLSTPAASAHTLLPNLNLWPAPYPM
jgi:hypothetical protein